MPKPNLVHVFLGRVIGQRTALIELICGPVLEHLAAIVLEKIRPIQNQAAHREGVGDTKQPVVVEGVERLVDNIFV